MRYGATDEEWAHFDIVLGLGEDLLPTVCDPSVAPSPRSSIKEHGRTPSVINREGQMAGIKAWTSIKANGELKRWSRDVRYGICLQTRHVRGIDIDVPDPILAQRIADAVTRILGFKLPVRRRENTGKRLLAVVVKGEIAKKRFDVNGGAIEFLGNGQMFVAAGARVDGSRYWWDGGLPSDIPEISLEQYQALITELSEEFGVTPVREASSGTRRRGEDLDVEDPVADWLHEQGLVLGETSTGALKIACPWADEHTSGEEGDSSTVWFPAGTNGHPTGHFKCMHSHCEGRNRSDYLAAVEYPDDRADDFEDLGPDPEADKDEKDDKSPAELSSFAFKLQPIHEFAAQPSGGWIVKNVIPKAELGIIYGASGSGKTFIILDIALAVARGVAWRGLRVRQGRVVYIVAEGAGGFRKRARAYAQQNGIDLKDVDVLVLDAVPNLLDEKQVKLLSQAIEAAGPISMIVVDTFAQMTPGANENAAEDMGKAINHVRSVGRRVGACVVLVHHAGKDAAKGARGWSGLRAAADFELEVTRDGDNRTLNTTKQKDADDQEQWGFTLQEITIGIDDDGDDITSCVVAESTVMVDAGVNGGKRRAPAKSWGVWGEALLDVYQELSLGGDVLKSELVIRAADQRPDAGTVKVRRGNVRAKLAAMRKGDDSPFLPPDKEMKEDRYVVMRG